MLSEPDARAITAGVVRELQWLGATVQRILIQRDGEGLLFLASLNGRVVYCQVPAGTIPFRTVALELLGAAGIPQPTPFS